MLKPLRTVADKCYIKLEMIKTTAPGLTPSPKAEDKAQSKGGDGNSALMMFTGAVLDLSWRMAGVVLIPIIGGYELDRHFKTSPTFTILGFILAMAGTFVVLKQMLNTYSGQNVSGPTEDK